MVALIGLVLILALLVGGVAVRPVLAFAAPLLLTGLDMFSSIAHPFFTANPIYMNLMVGSLVAYGVAFFALRGRLSQVPVSAVWYLVIALYGYAWATTSWAPPPPAWLADHFGNDGTRFGTFLPYMLVYLVLSPLLIREAKELRAPFTFFLLIGCFLVIAMLAFGEFHSWKRGFVLAGDADARTSPLPVANFAGLVVLAALLVRTTVFSAFFKLVRPVAVLGGLVVIVAVAARGQLFGTVLLSMVLWPIAQGDRFRTGHLKGIVGAGVVLIAVWVAFELVGDVQGYRWQVGGEADVGETQATMYGRAAAQAFMMSSVLEAWYSDPWTLVFGAGNSASFTVLPHQFYPHNVPLEVLLEEGLVGITIYALIIVLTIRAFRRLRARFRDNPEALGYICFLFGVFALYFILSLKQGSLVSGGHYVFLPAIVLANVELASRHSVRRVRGYEGTRVRGGG